jgi:hypothetical protein
MHVQCVMRIERLRTASEGGPYTRKRNPSPTRDYGGWGTHPHAWNG